MIITMMEYYYHMVVSYGIPKSHIGFFLLLSRGGSELFSVDLVMLLILNDSKLWVKPPTPLDRFWDFATGPCPGRDLNRQHTNP